MAVYGSIGHILELSIQAEALTEHFYLELAKKFRHYEELRAFWLNYATEENNHRRFLEKLQRRAAAEKLQSMPDDSQLLENAQKNASIPVETILEGIKTLQDAFNIAHKLEHSEVNGVFLFLLDTFPQEQDVQEFMRNQIDEHANRIMFAFPKRFGTGTLRRGIVPQADEG